MENELNLIVYDTDRTAIGIIDSAISLIWTDRYDDVGEFELYTEVTPEVLALLSYDRYLSIPESTEWMVIETMQIKTDEEEGDTLKVTGRSLLSLFERRQERDNAAYGGGGGGLRSDSVLGMLTTWAFGSWDSDKEVSYIDNELSTDTRITTDLKVLSLEFRTGSSNKNILDSILTMSKIYGHGLKVTPDSNKNFIISVYLGQDRSYNQTDNPYVIFSPEFNNLESSEWLSSKRPYKTFLYTHGAPEPPPPAKATSEIASAPTGINRREAFYDGSYVSPYVDGTSTLKDANDYLDELSEEGDYELLDRGIFTYFTGKALNESFFYGEHYFLGDLVQFENSYGVGGAALITEITISKDETGVYIYPTFEFIN